MSGIYHDTAQRGNYHIVILHFNYHDNYSMTHVQLHNYKGLGLPNAFGWAVRQEPWNLYVPYFRPKSVIFHTLI